MAGGHPWPNQLIYIERDNIYIIFNSDMYVYGHVDLGPYLDDREDVVGIAGVHG